MKGSNKPPICMCSTPRQEGKRHFHELYMQQFEGLPTWFVVDFDKHSVVARGDVIKRDGKVTHVRFST